MVKLCAQFKGEDESPKNPALSEFRPTEDISSIRSAASNIKAAGSGLLKGTPDIVIVDNNELGDVDGYIDVPAKDHRWVALRFSTLKEYRSKIDHGHPDSTIEFGSYIPLPQNNPRRKQGAVALAFANAICSFLNSVKIQQADKMCLTSFATNNVLLVLRGFSVFSRILSIQISQDLLQKINS